MAAPAPAPLEGLTEAQWAAYDRDGYLVLDCAATEAEVAALNERLDDIMQGRVQYGERLVMQLDPSSSLMGGSAAAPAPAAAAAAAAVGVVVDDDRHPGVAEGPRVRARPPFLAAFVRREAEGLAFVRIAQRVVPEAAHPRDKTRKRHRRRRSEAI